MDFLQSHLDFLLAHLLSIALWSFLIEAAGIPFPSRILLLVVATLISEPREFFFSSRRRHTSLVSDWSSDVCSSDLGYVEPEGPYGEYMGYYGAIHMDP